MAVIPAWPPHQGPSPATPAWPPHRGPSSATSAWPPHRGPSPATSAWPPPPHRGPSTATPAWPPLHLPVDTNCRRVCTRPLTVGGGRSTSIRSGLAAWPALVTCSWDQPQSNPAMQTKLLPYKNNLDYHAAIYCTVKEHD